MPSTSELGKSFFHTSTFSRGCEQWDNKSCRKCVGLSMWSVTVARRKSLGERGAAAPGSSGFIPSSWFWGGLSWQCLLDLSLRALPEHFQQFVPGASTECPVMNLSTCAKTIPGFWVFGGFFASFLNCNLIESLVLLVIFFASAPHLWFYRSQWSQFSLFGFFSFSKLPCPSLFGTSVCRGSSSSLGVFFLWAVLLFWGDLATTFVCLLYPRRLNKERCAF